MYNICTYILLLFNVKNFYNTENLKMTKVVYLIASRVGAFVICK